MVGLHVDYYFYRIGHPDFLHSFFSTIAVNLENEQWGSRFPVLMNELYMGKLEPGHIDAAAGELATIGAELAEIPIDRVVWDIEDRSLQPPWGDKVPERVKNLAEYFINDNGETFLKKLSQALEDAKRRKTQVTIGPL